MEVGKGVNLVTVLFTKLSVPWIVALMNRYCVVIWLRVPNGYNVSVVHIPETGSHTVTEVCQLPS
jgi:hypothetical protein